MMPADPETARELGKLTQAVETVVASVQRLDESVAKSWAEGRQETRRVYQRIETHARESAASISVIGEKISVVASELNAHSVRDDERFERQDRALESAKRKGEEARRAMREEMKEASKDRGKVWRTLAGMGTGGAVGAAIAEWFKGGSA